MNTRKEFIALRESITPLSRRIHHITPENHCSLTNRIHQSSDTTHFTKREIAEVHETLAEPKHKEIHNDRKEVRAALILEFRRDELIHDVEHAQQTGNNKKRERRKPRSRSDRSDLGGFVE